MMPSSYKNLADIAPNRVVAADRNPRERGLRPLNNNR
jgi:hypothetical protein